MAMAKMYIFFQCNTNACPIQCHRGVVGHTHTHLHERDDPDSSFVCEGWQCIHQFPQERDATVPGCIHWLRPLGRFTCLTSVRRRLVVCCDRLSVCQSVIQVNIAESSVLSFYRLTAYVT